MTDREIIQALECCKNDFSNSNCLDCPYNKEKSAKCITFMIEDALALILRQQAEIERLTINMNAFGLGMKQEKERADTIRAEAIKEFMDRLTNKADLIRVNSLDSKWAISQDDLDRIYEEMVGEQGC